LEDDSFENSCPGDTTVIAAWIDFTDLIREVDADFWGLEPYELAAAFRELKTCSNVHRKG
jgi:hypothetical protein